jgi:hypothetical protein
VSSCKGCRAAPVIKARLLLEMRVRAPTVTRRASARAWDPRVAKAHDCSSPSGGDRRARDPLEDWIRKDAALADAFSVQQPVVDRIGSAPAATQLPCGRFATGSVPGTVQVWFER